MIQKKAPEGVEPVVKTRQAQLHPWHAAADIPPLPRLACAFSLSYAGKFLSENPPGSCAT